jgi:hypothetical protein
LSTLPSHVLHRAIKRLARPAVVLSVLAVSTAFAAEPSPAGLWKTIDDHSRRPRGVVQIYEKKGAFFGKVEAPSTPAKPPGAAAAVAMIEKISPSSA